ncbi:defensin-like protein 113 [Capsella rubella]|uniref:defensin-like protein 113 n=1 Tax=Capsella rubella TaxID=81985 RepID=UPI000CD4D4DB|nr:defensin-like protein 113 [Capsella rubella]
MTYSKKTLIVFVFTILFVMSSVHCSKSNPDYSDQANGQCYSPCRFGDEECDICCVGKSVKYFGKCISRNCHCLIKADFDF